MGKTVQVSVKDKDNIYVKLLFVGDCPCNNFDCNQLQPTKESILIVYDHDGDLPVMLDILGNWVVHLLYSVFM